MDNAHKKLEIGLEQIYDHVRRPFERLYLKLAVTQNGLQPPEHLTPLLDRIQRDTRHKNFNILMNEPIEKREIDNWSMKAFDLSENEPQDWALLEELRDAYLNTFKVSSKQLLSWIQHFIKDYPRFKHNERV